MMPPYLCSVRRSRGRAEQIGQDSQTSLLWLWSRSNSLPFPEALSAMTQGFHYHYNQRPLFHQPATQKVLLTGDGVCVCLSCVWTHTHTLVCTSLATECQTRPAKKDQKMQKWGSTGLKVFFHVVTNHMNMTTLNDLCIDSDWTRHIKAWPLLGWMKYLNFQVAEKINNSVYTVLLPRFAWKALKSNQAPTHAGIMAGHGDDFYSSSFIPPILLNRQEIEWEYTEGFIHKQSI